MSHLGNSSSPPSERNVLRGWITRGSTRSEAGTQNHTALVTPGCEQVSMGKIKQRATAMCVYSSPARSMVTGFIEKGLSARSYQTEVNPAMFSLSDRVGKKLTGCVLHVSIGRKLAVIRDAEKLKNSESTVGSLPEGFKELICFGCVDLLDLQYLKVENKREETVKFHMNL